MTMSLHNLKAQLLANKTKSAILGALVCVGAFVVVQNFVLPGPRLAVASLPHGGRAPGETGETETPALSPIELEQRAAQAKALWEILQEKRGVAPADAFAFDPAYYTLDPAVAAQRAKDAPPLALAPVEKSPVKNADAPNERAKALVLREQAKALGLRSTVLGSNPTAIINSGVYHVGDQIEGFRIVTIRARQVMVEKDGITLAVDMAK